jgi:hypothetical protein
METITVQIKKEYAREVLNDLQAMEAIDFVEPNEERKTTLLAWVEKNRENAPKINPSINIRELIDETHNREL